MALFFAPSRTRPTVLWGRQFDFFLLSYSRFAGSFCPPSHLFQMLSGLQGDSLRQFAELGCSLMYRAMRDADSALCRVFPLAAQ